MRVAPKADGSAIRLPLTPCRAARITGVRRNGFGSRQCLPTVPTAVTHPTGHIPPRVFVTVGVVTRKKGITR